MFYSRVFREESCRKPCARAPGVDHLTTGDEADQLVAYAKPRFKPSSVVRAVESRGGKGSGCSTGYDWDRSWGSNLSRHKSYSFFCTNEQVRKNKTQEYVYFDQ